MKHFIPVIYIVILVVTLASAFACKTTTLAPATSPPSLTTTPASGPGDQDQAAISAAVIRKLATEDDTFGGNLKPTRLFIIRYTDDRAGNPGQGESASVLMSQDIQNKITEALRDLPATVIWIDKPEDAEFEGGEFGFGTVKDGAIFRLGNIHPQPDSSMQLAGSIYVANLAAGGRTYILEKQNGAWTITGTTGVMWIS